jgi:hypothetical protein
MKELSWELAEEVNRELEKEFMAYADSERMSECERLQLHYYSNRVIEIIISKLKKEDEENGED